MSIASSNTTRNCTKLRIVFLGDQGVGKSSIIDRYTTNRFEDAHNPTVGIDFNVRDLNKNGQLYRLQMWDTAGQQRYRSLIPTYLKNAHCVVFVYDVTVASSLQNVRIWYKMFIQHQQAPGILVGNKSDLSSSRKVTKQQVESLAKELKLHTDEVSAKNGKGINDLFANIVDVILNSRKKEEEFVESSRQKMKDMHTIIENGVQEQSKQQKSTKIMSLKAKGLQLAKKLHCCSGQ